jgi:2-oxoglutarate ferredoxin oxidoreductase subunit delta
MKNSFRIIIDRDRCKGCELCIPVCPQQLLVLSVPMNRRGNHYPEAKKNVACRGCLKCAVMCPEAAIQIEVV